MHSSKSVIRKIAGPAAAVLALAAILILLDLALYPCTFTRVDVHDLATQTYDDVILGASHGKMNVSPAAMAEVSGRTGHNACVGGEYPVDSYYLVKLMIGRGHTPGRVIYVASPEYYCREKEEGNNYLLFFHEFPLGLTRLQYFADTVAGCDLRTGLTPWYEYSLSYELAHVKENLTKKLTGDYSIDDLRSDTQAYREDGFIERYPVDPATFTDDVEEFSADSVVEENTEWFRRLAALCRAHGIDLVTVITPAPEASLTAHAQSYAEASDYFAALCEEEAIRFIDFNAEPYTNAFTHHVTAFTDLTGHMHGDAARDFSHVLASVLEEEG